METATTRDIRVSVEAFFLEEQSHPGEGRYVFAYRVRLKNLGATKVQLISRHWIITDGQGDVREVRGQGVVGRQPVMLPGEEYEYVSGSELATPLGTMEGTYRMVDEAGQAFDVRIPLFTLAVPGVVN